MNKDLIRSEREPFLKAGVELLVSVNVEREILLELANHLEGNDGQVVKPPRNCYLRVQLKQDLEISFRLFSSGNIKKELEGCRCQILALPDEDIFSLNQAYQRISATFEPSRTSVGGRVYDNFYFQGTDGTWRLLEEKRQEVYQPYRAEFEKVSHEIKKKKLRDAGISIPRGTCIIIRRDSQQPIMAFPIQLYNLLDTDIPFDEDSKLISFGPFPENEIWEYIYRLQEVGLIYGKDFVHFQSSLPDWCRLLALPV